MTEEGLRKIRTALISVYDKTGLVPFARNLSDRGVRIVSTGNTARALREAGIPVREASKVTGFPEILGGRVKTLHPKIHGGILAKRSDPAHQAVLKKLRIQAIDLVVVQLYPFEKTLKSGAPQAEVIEMIDVGGPAMLRAAAKNFGDVTALPDPADYAEFLDYLDRFDNQTPFAFRRKMAAKVFAVLADYDGLVAGYLGEIASQADGSSVFPERLQWTGRRLRELRYGENPHQKGALYELKGSEEKGLLSAKILWGKELSFNNYLDLEAAWSLVSAFEESCAAVIKHNNPCGFGLDKDPARAFVKAFEGDPLSSFGGIIGFNRAVDARAARAILKAGFFECVVAPEFSDEAIAKLTAKKNLRLLKVPRRRFAPQSWDCKRITGALLVQEPDREDVPPGQLKRVTRRAVTASTAKELALAFKLLRFIRSNAIAVFKKDRLLGAGMGLTSRVDSAELALKKAGRRARGAVLASDGFFPKPDSIDLARRYGIRAIVQPGGSIQDEAVIEACNRAGIAMVFTGVRHFSH